MPDIKPPICKDCLYPVDNKRRLLFFNCYSDMVRFLEGGNTEIVEFMRQYDNSEEKAVLLQCPTFNCAKGYLVDSIESLIEKLNWFPQQEVPEDSPEYLKRVLAGKLKSRLMLIEILKSGEPIE